MASQLVLGFKEATSSEVFGEGNCKFVPWISWDEWSFVRESLFSSSSGSIDSALRRISAWRSRGCLPVMIEVTASIVEIQQKDSFFRNGLSESDLLPENMLVMLYCMTIMRLVNGVVEKNRKKNEISIAEAADVFGIPRMLIDIRHECSHRDLPSLRLVRLASTKALDWLKSYYWEPQRMAIPYASDRRKEIKSKIHELVFSLNEKQRSNSSVVKGKRIKPCEHLCGRNKFLSVMAIKLKSSKPSGSKKHVNKALKNLLKLYASFSSEVVSILLEFLLKEFESVDLEGLPNSSQVSITGAYETRLDDWKPLIIKLSNKEPEMLLSLLKAVLQMIETRGASKYDVGSETKAGFHQTEHLSALFEWLVGNLRGLKPTRRKITAMETVRSPIEKSLPKSTLVDLLRKSLMVSSLGNNRLTAAALALAQMSSNSTLVDKLDKLASIHATSADMFEDPSPVSSESFHAQQEKSIRQAANKIEFLKRRLTHSSNLKTPETNNRWVVAKSWKPCPIGALPCDLDSSGLVPVLDIVDDREQKVKLAGSDKKWELNPCRGKRVAECSVAVLDNSDVKKLKESEGLDDDEYEFSAGVKGRAMIGGVWKRVTEDDVVDIASGVRILV